MCFEMMSQFQMKHQSFFPISLSPGPSLKSLARPLVGHSSGAVRIACDMQVDGMQGSEGLKLTWKKVTENDCSELKLTTVDRDSTPKKGTPGD